MAAVEEKVVIVWGPDDGRCFDEGPILIGAVENLNRAANRRNPVVDVHLLQHDWRRLVWRRNIGTGTRIQAGAIAKSSCVSDYKSGMEKGVLSYSHLVD